MKAYDMNEKRGSVTRLMWVYISGAAFILFTIFSILLIFYADRISAFGITKSFYYILLIPVGLCSAAFLFGAMHSHAKYTGKNSYGQLELTGPVVIFCLVVIGGFYFAPPETTFMLTVRVLDINNHSLVKNGILIADFGPQRIKREISENGDVQFPELPSKFLNTKVNLIPEIEGYTRVNYEPLKIPGDKVIDLFITQRKDTTFVRGTVIDKNGNPLPGIALDFESGLATVVSNEAGRFEVNIPEKSGTSMLLIATRDGTTGFNDYISIPEKRSLIIRFEQ